MPKHTRINKERIDEEVYNYFVVNGEYPEFKNNKSIFVSDVPIISKSTTKKGSFSLFGQSKYRWATTSGVATTVAKRLDILGKGFIFAQVANATKQVSEPTEHTCSTGKIICIGHRHTLPSKFMRQRYSVSKAELATGG
jgi:hypothetical protein